MKNKESLLIPGPTPVIDPIYEALSQETWSHTDPRFAEVFSEAIEQTKEMFQTDGEVFIIAGSGTLAMEMAVVNTVNAGEKLLVVSNGYFGDRFMKLGEAFNIGIEVVQAEWGKSVTAEELKAKLAEDTFKAVTITHADTSTGVAADLDALVPVIKHHGALAILDGVCASAAIEEDMSKGYGTNRDQLDVVLTASQKAIGVPPGLAVVAFNQSALDVRDAMEHVPAYYTDIYNWIPIMHNPKKYFATPPVNLIYAYNKAMQLVLEEGMEDRYERHLRFSKAIKAGLAVYGMQALADEDVAATTLTCVLYPEGVDDAEFRAKLAEKGIVVAGALAHLSGKAFRIGHMGNASRDMLKDAVQLIGETLLEMDQVVEVNRALEMFEWEFSEQAMQ